MLSVIVPVFNQWDRVQDLLACMARQTLDQQAWELLLIDNGSKSISLPEVLPGNARMLQCEQAGSYAARNHGAAEAQGDFLVFTDADCLPADDWLERLRGIAASMVTESCLCAGAVKMISDSDKPSASEIYDLVKGIPQQRYVSQGWATTANLMVPRTVFENLGGFDVTRFSGGDADFCRRAVASGVGLKYLPEAIVQHPTRKEWSDLVTKVRRMKGGQIAAGTKAQRLTWSVRTMIPPFRPSWHCLTAAHAPWRYRWVAVGVQWRLWLVGLQEMFRLIFGGAPERR